MIKNILVPERVGDYYVFSKRIVGFDIDKTNVAATQIYLKGKSVTVERCVDEKLELGKQLTHNEKVVNTIKKIVSDLGKFDAIYTAIPSSQVVFKSLKFPFTSRSKIKMVIDYEVEPLLPFSLKDAVVDFVITSKNIEENSSEILVAAVQKSYIENHVKLFHDAGVHPKKVFVDLFALYSLYKKVPAYKDLNGGVALVDVGFSDTRIAYIYNGKLSFVRTLPNGIFAMAKTFANKYDITQPEAVEMLMRFGLEKNDDEQYKVATQSVFSSFWADIKFTLQTFASQLNNKSVVSQILMLGQGSNIPGISTFVEDTLSIPCHLFKIDSLVENKVVYVKNSLSIPRSNILSIAIALPSEITDDFNLFTTGDDAVESALFNKQVIMALVLSLIIVIVLIVHSAVQIGRLKNEINESEQQAIEELKSKIKIKIEEEGDEQETLDEVVEAAKAAVKNQETVWSAFSTSSRVSTLKYLLALHDAVDIKDLGITVKSIRISHPDKKMIFKAQVRDLAALRKLEKALKKSKLLKKFEPQEDKVFEMKIALPE